MARNEQEVIPVKGSRTYRVKDVKQLKLPEALKDRGGERAILGLDVSKDDTVMVLRWSDGRIEGTWRSANPAGIRDLVSVVGELGEGRELIVGMEPTGTYGDALRQSLTGAGLTVHRVSGKATHDYAEIYDGVPSQHDGKDAAIVAELVSLGKSSPWPYAAASEDDQAREYWVERLMRAREMWQKGMGRLEGMLARHWPEVTRLLELNSVALVRALAHYGSPQRLREDAEAAARLRKWSGSRLSEEKIGEVLKSAWETVGIVAGEYPSRGIRDCAESLLELHAQRREAKQHLEQLCEEHAVLKRHRRAVGACTASALWVWLGDPRQYGSGEAYRKAMGLNLKECSSGRHRGRLKITKRGSGMVRWFLYMAALRQVKLSGVRRWYAAKKARDGGRGGKGVVAVMRKLAMALYRVAVEDEEYDPRKLFPGSPLRKMRAEAAGAAVGNDLGSGSTEGARNPCEAKEESMRQRKRTTATKDHKETSA